MTKKSGSGGGGRGRKGGSTSTTTAVRKEVRVTKSPAEFFAENQSIAGFDNMGKSLYTTIRELVENSLDACESAGVLPDVTLTVEEMSMRAFNDMRGVSTAGVPEDEGEGQASEEKKEGGGDEGGEGAAGSGGGDGVDAKCEEKGGDGDGKDIKGVDADAPSAPPSSQKGEKPKITPAKNKKGGRGQKKKGRSSLSQEAYFRITVRDNGCGMDHDAVPDLLGRVLSGSKYGVRQTRGKFGLGAKMALIWSKKSAGVPISVTTSRMRSVDDDTGLPVPGEHVTRCVLDIDIYKNCPRVLEHTKSRNGDDWVGTEFEVIIAGNWTTYKSRIAQYLQQLAIITPYARLEMRYSNLSFRDGRKDVNLRYDRRSEQMPPPAREVKHHPSSVNNLLVQQLLEMTDCNTFQKFLCSDLAGVSPAVANRIVDRLSADGVKSSTPPSDVTDRQVTRLVQILRAASEEGGGGWCGVGGGDAKSHWGKLGFKPPDGSCLSPLGEYNLNLGIRKVVEPDAVATARDKAGSYDGHPFIVEAAVSLGGREAKEGITVVRFANRIPLLFEGGADVVTRVAQSKIRWSLYKIDHKRDRIGVFVSIVSTKVPFKGTGKVSPFLFPP